MSNSTSVENISGKLVKKLGKTTRHRQLVKSKERKIVGQLFAKNNSSCKVEELLSQVKRTDSLLGGEGKNRLSVLHDNPVS